MAKLKPKAAKLEKPNMPTDNRKADKVKRSQHREYLEYFHVQGHACLECGTKANIEAHHVVPQDNRTITPFCTFCHRGDERQGRKILNNMQYNTKMDVAKGYYLHRGTRSAEFSEKWTDEKLLEIADELYKEYDLNA